MTNCVEVLGEVCDLSHAKGGATSRTKRLTLYCLAVVFVAFLTTPLYFSQTSLSWKLDVLAQGTYDNCRAVLGGKRRGARKGHFNRTLIPIEVRSPNLQKSPNISRPA